MIELKERHLPLSVYSKLLLLFLCGGYRFFENGSRREFRYRARCNL
jgi:hypothetical protein